MKQLHPYAKLAVLCAVLLIGALLRLAWLEDMEYFADQRTAFQYSQAPFWNAKETTLENGLGALSSVGLRSPGLTRWSFTLLARTLSITHPLDLALAIRWINIGTLCLFLFFALKIVSESERLTWLWAWALMAVNPFALLFHRRVWTPVFLYFFVALLLIGFWRREKPWGSALWGLTGALLPQFHMLAGALSASFLLWAWMNRQKRKLMCFWPWLFASFIGTIPCLPWIVYFLQQLGETGTHTGMHSFWLGLQMRFWRYWFTQPFGLLLTYALEPGGYFKEFLSYPLLLGKKTYLVAMLHLLALGITLLIVGRSCQLFWQKFRASFQAKALTPLANSFGGRESNTMTAVQSGLWGFGIATTAKTFYVFRHYLIASAPLEFAWLTGTALSLPKKWGFRILLLLFFVELGISVAFLNYIHKNGGAPGAEYGHTFRRQMEMGIWTSNNNPAFHRDIYQPPPSPPQPIPFERIPTDYR